MVMGRQIWVTWGQFTHGSGGSCVTKCDALLALIHKVSPPVTSSRAVWKQLHVVAAKYGTVQQYSEFINVLKLSLCEQLNGQLMCTKRRARLLQLTRRIQTPQGSSINGVTQFWGRNDFPSHVTFCQTSEPPPFENDVMLKNPHTQSNCLQN